MDSELIDLDALALVGMGFYGIMVYQNGNVDPFLKALSNETGYLEFLISLALVKWAIDNDFTGLAAPIATLAVLAIALKLSGRYDLTAALSDFAAGRAGLLETLFKGMKADKINTNKVIDVTPTISL